MRARRFWLLVVSWGVMVAGGCTTSPRANGFSALRPVTPDRPGVWAFEFTSSTIDYPKGEAGRQANLKKWLALNNMKDYQVVDTQYLASGHFMGAEHGMAYYWVHVTK